MRNAARDVGLNAERVARRTVVCMRPHMTIRGSLDELSGDPETRTIAHHRSLEDVGGAQLPCDAGQREMGLAVLHGRGPGDHARAVNLRESGDERLGQRVGTGALVRIDGAIELQATGRRIDRQMSASPGGGLAIP